jgi:N-acetylmuramic acid 6-phosphate (MurNAc-6-P) etherase
VGGFRLLYCWYDAPGPEAVKHRSEIEDFAATVRADRVQFQSITYQDVIVRLAKSERGPHREYVDYLAERYL